MKESIADILAWGAILGYIISPIDIIPDVVPILGLGDDVTMFFLHDKMKEILQKIPVLE